MRVLIDTTFALRGTTGTGVYIERLASALDDIGVEVIRARNDRRRPPAGGGLASARNLAGDQAWTAYELPRLARECNADVLHHPLPAHSRRAQCAQAVTVHDLAYERLPEHFDARWRAYARFAHRRAARCADAVIAVSETTALDVASRWGVVRSSIVVARHGPGQEPDTASRRSAPRHLLYVGDAEPRKNLGLLLAAHRRWRESADGNGVLPLVLAGDIPGGLAGNGVEVVRRPDAAALGELLDRAAALVHPSLHEGFGLTPLEAMSSGVPVIAARSPGVTETCDDAALYVDPHDADALAAVLARVAADSGLRADLRERGRRRAAAFSWTRSARAHVEAYTLAMELRAQG